MTTEVKLTEGELAAARSFGLTAEEYAKFKGSRAEISGPGEPLTADELQVADVFGMTPAEYEAYKSRQPSEAS